VENVNARTAPWTRAAPATPVLFAAGLALFVGAAAVVSGIAPVQMSVAVVFLFAGPHNWIEFRYLLSRMPARWGRSRAFFSLALTGAAGLTAGYACLPRIVSGLGYGEPDWASAIAAWDTLAVAWIVVLVQVHGRQVGRDVGWALPAGLLLVAAAWWAPFGWALGLVYLHPLVALWFVDRELRRRPEWRAAYRVALACLPFVVGLLWLALARTPSVTGDDGVTLRIAQHAGAGLLPGISSRLLIATHTFLETVHYGAWVLLMPLAGFRVPFWKASSVPLARRSGRWSAAVQLALVAGAALMVALWICFAADYATTRDVYFTVAILHVLAEAPFVVRAMR